jgi:hypothetical protein
MNGMCEIKQGSAAGCGLVGAVPFYARGFYMGSRLMSGDPASSAELLSFQMPLQG